MSTTAKLYPYLVAGCTLEDGLIVGTTEQVMDAVEILVAGRLPPILAHPEPGQEPVRHPDSLPFAILQNVGWGLTAHGTMIGGAAEVRRAAREVEEIYGPMRKLDRTTGDDHASI